MGRGIESRTHCGIGDIAVFPVVYVNLFHLVERQISVQRNSHLLPEKVGQSALRKAGGAAKTFHYIIGNGLSVLQIIQYRGDTFVPAGTPVMQQSAPLKHLPVGCIGIVVFPYSAQFIHKNAVKSAEAFIVQISLIQRIRKKTCGIEKIQQHIACLRVNRMRHIGSNADSGCFGNISADLAFQTAPEGDNKVRSEMTVDFRRPVFRMYQQAVIFKDKLGHRCSPFTV